jgi:tRNA(fMet)-specific endonuclease VapC
MSLEDWLLAADIYAESVRTARSIADDDLFQAAFCIKHGYILVTHNTKHFQHIPNLQIADWVE